MDFVRTLVKNLHEDVERFGRLPCFDVFFEVGAEGTENFLTGFAGLRKIALLGGGHSSQSVGRTFRDRGGGLCHAAGDMRAYGAREGIAGMYGAGDSGGI